MKKYLYACLITCVTPSAFAAWGTGFYATIGIGGGWLDVNEIQDFALDYPNVRFDNPDLSIRDSKVIENYNDTAVYDLVGNTVLAGRASLGYLWDIFDGEPTKIGESIYTINATFGLEFGYRLFDKVSDSHTEQETDDTFAIPDFQVFETATSDTYNQAFDLQAVARLPFDEDRKFALLLKGGIAYNMNRTDTDLVIEADLEEEPQDGYNRDLSFDSITNDEWLPVATVGLEYMLYAHLGFSAEYSAIFASSDNADSQLFTGNIIFRL